VLHAAVLAFRNVETTATVEREPASPAEAERSGTLPVKALKRGAAAEEPRSAPAEDVTQGVAMYRTLASLTVACALLLVVGSVEVSGQAPCAIVGDFAILRDAIGSQTVGTCLEDERANVQNGNIEQHTSGGLLLRRTGSPIVAFTDGVTTWIYGPYGVQTRPNGQQFPWEVDFAAAMPSFVMTATAPPPPPGEPASPVALTSPAALASPAALTDPNTLPPPPGAPASGALAAPASLAPPTPPPTPTPAVRVRFREKPDSVDTGSDARFEVETNVDKGTCALGVAYRGKDEVPVAVGDIDDNRCELKYTLPKDVRTGKATARIYVTATEGTATVDDDFEVEKGDMVLGGDLDIEIDADNIPDEVEVGDEFKVAIETNLKDKGKCDLSITWPRHTTYAGESQTPDDDGRCSWRVKVPVEIPKSGTATLTVLVRKNTRKDSTEYRVLTKEIDVEK
jgi:hypothetical protein